MNATRAATASRAFAVSVAGWTLVFSGEDGAWFGLLFALLCVLAGRVGERVAPGVLVRVATQVLGMAAALGALTVVSAVRPRFGVYFTVAWLALATPRLFWKLDRRGDAITLGFALLALMGMGRATNRVAFGVAVAAFLASALVSTMRADKAFGSILRHPKGLLGPLVLALSIAGLTMAGLGWALPAAEPAVTEALQPYVGADGSARSGFGDGEMKLGSVAEITTSNEVVMRVYGDADHVRGQVYSDYVRGGWRYRKQRVDDVTSEDGRVQLGGGAAKSTVRYEATPSAGQVFFAPLGAQSMRAMPGAVRDPYGIVRVPRMAHGDARSWTVEADPAGPQGVAAPSESDRYVHPVRDKLTRRQKKREALFSAIAERWVTDVGATTDRARLDAIRSRLAREYAYTLKPKRVRGLTDPTLAFLTDSKQGHCEYFASATVLLARSLGIPARVASGYRVFEYNPAGAYHIVRMRDAHAWAEVWLDGRWHTFDTTPPGMLAGEGVPESGAFEAYFDLVRRAFGRAFERLAAITLTESLVAASVIGGLVLLWVFVRRERAAKADVGGLPEGFEPLAALEAWVAQRLGLERRPHHTLARYAAALREAGHGEAATLVEACAALRYGGDGDARALAESVAAYTRSR